MRRCSDEQRKPKFDRNSWTTPKEIFEPLDKIFHFGLDAAALRKNRQVDTWLSTTGFHKIVKGITESIRYEDGGLGNISWASASEGKPVFLNPPHSGPLLRKFVYRALDESRAVPVVCLLPGTTDVVWFHDLAARTDEPIEFVFIKGRVRYLNPDTKQPLSVPQVGALLVVLGDNEYRSKDYFGFLTAYTWRPVTQ